jgi:inner membrane protein
VDPVTHILSGAAAGLATAPERNAAMSLRERMLVCALAAEFPDIDILVRFAESLAYLNAHRGITHSVVMLPVWALLLAWPLARWRKDAGNLSDYFRIVALGLAVHILGDWITGWGTQLFAPLSAQVFTLNTTFIIDPVITILLATGLLVQRYLPRPQRAAQAALAAVALYVGLQAHLQQRAIAVARDYAESHAPGAKVHVFPQPFSPAHWRLLIETSHAYDEADLDLWATRARESAPPDAAFWRRISSSYQPAAQLRWRRIPRYGAEDTAPFARAAWGADEFAAFRRFAVFPALYRVVNDGAENCAYFFDLRFNLNGRIPPFRYGACRQGSGWQLRPYALE